MAYGQWVSIIVQNTGGGTLRLANFRLVSGKLYANGDKNQEIAPDMYNGFVLKPEHQIQINSCGRENAPEGTTGSLDLLDAESGELVRTLYWHSPWGRNATNDWRMIGSNDKWNVECVGGYSIGGALGSINVCASIRSGS